MLKQKTILEVCTDKKIYRFECDPDSALGEIHDVLSQMKHYVIQRIIDERKKELQEPTPVERQEVKNVQCD